MVFRASVLSLCITLSATHLHLPVACAQAQAPGVSIGGGRLGQGTFVSPNFVLNLAVQVRGTDGAPIPTIAFVTLYSISGLPISTTTTKGTQALFTQLAPGSYYVEVEAPGYWKAREDALIQPNVSDNIVLVALAPAVAGVVQPVRSHTPLLPPELQKQLNKGVAQLKAGNLDAAEKLINSVLKKAPNHPDVLYLAGIVAEKKGQIDLARNHWRKASSLDPKYLLATYALAQSYLGQEDYVKAEELGQAALDVDPNSWNAHSILAAAAFKQEHYAAAVSHGERALEIGKEKAADISIVLAQALAVQGRPKEAIQLLYQYLRTKPEPAREQLTQRLLDRLNSKAERFAIVDAATDKSSPDLTQPPISPLAEHWRPPNIDDAIPPVEPGAVCDLPDALSKAGEELRRLPEALDRFSATETVEDQFVGDSGIASNANHLSFSYVVSIHETRRGSLNLEEYRNGSDEDSVFPDHFATRGLPSQVFIFHPYYQGDFLMSCEGLARHGAGFAWQIRFEQKRELPSRVQSHYLNGRRFHVPLKGRAWVSASNFQVLELQTDLREPLKQVDLLAQHIDIEYGPIRFQKDNQELWLPIRADFYSQIRGRRIHRRHDFHDYILFAVEDREEIGKPKETTEPQ